MPLLGCAAMLLSFDVAPEAIDEHDDWHTHEHLPERLSIPGFLRGSRWVSTRGGPRYMVLYEVFDLATLTSDPYLQRLDNPSAWTRKMMPHYRGMNRGLCSVVGSVGLGVGNVARLVRFAPQPAAAEALQGWLLSDVMPALPFRPGIGSVHLLKGDASAPMTTEQRIRGADAGVDLALIVMGYREDALSSNLPRTADLEGRGAARVLEGEYRLDYSLTREECN